MKHLYLLVLASFFASTLLAQDDGEPVINNPVIQITSNTLFGKVIDKATGKGLPAVSVQLYTGANRDSLVSAMFTKDNGDFSFRNFPVGDSFRLKMSAIGYVPQEQLLEFAPANSASNGIRKDLGNIVMEQDVQTLTGVTVTAQRPALQMGIDRRVFSPERALTATGGTAVDVMKNIPSVAVDVDGNVTLRNSTPQIFVDGRPTILTLDQIPADNIERVELITNPSAKFDAASTGGIINVVLKRNKRVGLNGVASVGAGHPDILNGNLNLNAREGKFNFFASGSYNQSGGKSDGITERQNKNNGIIDNYFNQRSESNRNRRFHSLRFGVDYFLDNRNTISVTQGIVRGTFKNNEVQDQEYFNSNQLLERYGDRTSEGRSGFNRNTSELNFSHKFPDAGKELTAGITYNYGDGNTRTNIFNRFFKADGTEFSSPAQVRNQGNNKNDQVTMQIDFVNPLKNENARLETGVRSYVNNYSNQFSTFAMTNGSEVLLPLSNNIEYREMVNAFYITYSNKIKSFSYQAGLRAEQSDFKGKLLDKGQEFGYKYPDSFKKLFDALFPSLFLTKQLNEKAEMQLNYSRRIRRPGFNQLNPFIDINDPVNISQGNPELRPEFTNSFELNYSQQYNSGSMLASVFFRNNQGDITRYSDTITAAQYQQLNNAAVDPNAILNTFVNAQYTNRLGAEFTLQHKIGKNFDITPTINAEYQAVKAEINGLNLSNNGINWEAKLITNYRITTPEPSLFNNFSFQAIGEYESPRIMPQGKQIPQYSVDLALRKDFLKDKRASLTFSVNDVFWTNRWGAIYDTENFYQESSRRSIRNFRLNFSYRFGNADFKILNRNNNDNNDDE